MDDARPQDDMTSSSRIPGFYLLSRNERLQKLVEQGHVSPDNARRLREGELLDQDTAESMIENVIGTFELPIGLGLNFIIDGVSRIVPMVVEEPSIVAGISHIAKIVAGNGGFTTEVDDSLMIGQVQLTSIDNPIAAAKTIRENQRELIDIANKHEPGMEKRGGGACDLETRILSDGEDEEAHMLVVHLTVDTCDAMGANVVNTMCEAIAPRIEELTGGRVFLRILSNLADKRRVRASCEIPVEDLDWKGFSGNEVGRGVEQASKFAELDAYRAATHNKGIMNGIDAVAIATGQDWRAIEAGAHAWAARSGQYSPLATWRYEDDILIGDIELPMAIGVVGGPIRLHPTVRILLEMAGVEHAHELASIMGSVGLAQNLAAIKALATQGIQTGHMSLHARSVAATAGAPPHLVNQLAKRLIDCGEVKVARAETILAELEQSPDPATTP